MGPPLHSFIVCGDLHPIEEEMYDYYLENTGRENIKIEEISS